jgi:diguanylate cyclase (GGDEF)-like protein
LALARSRRSAAAYDADLPYRPVGRYIVGLALIAVFAVVSTLLVFRALSRQEDDATVVGVAANQIQLSQRLSEDAMALAAGEMTESKIGSIERTIARIDAVHDGLRWGDPSLGLLGDNSREIDGLLAAVEPSLDGVEDITDALLDVARDGGIPSQEQLDDLQTLTDRFEDGMATVAFRYQTEAEARVHSLKRTQLAFLGLIVVLLIFEVLFLFKPAVERVQEAWVQRDREHQSERAGDRKRLNYLAQYDPLTGLINRILFSDRLHSAITRARRDGGLVSLMFLDLDNFKAVNDHYGHVMGDELLKQVAARLTESVRESDTVARIGGDEFTVILEGAQRVEDAGHVATKILRALEVPYRVGNRELHVTASIGISLYPVDGDNAEALLRDADIAMYSAKAAGANTYQYFTPELREQTSERLNLIDGLRHALEAGGELELWYQPKIDAAAGKTVGVEALVRWRHPEWGLIMPSRFIPIAEDTDLMLPLGEWVLDEACRQLRAWNDGAMPGVCVSVNVSSRQIRRGNLVETVNDALTRHEVPPKQLEIELTEGAVVHDTELARRTLERLRTMGVRVSIDDFGTGYSSLSYLRRLPLDSLKLDRAFVRDLLNDEDAVALSSSIIALAKNLRLDIVAEGVESPEQLMLLGEMGCHKVQGFLLSHPLPADDFVEFAQNLDIDALLTAAVAPPAPAATI